MFERKYIKPEIKTKETLSMEFIATSIDVTSNQWEITPDDELGGI